MFGDWSLNARFFAQAGKRYTPQVLFGYDIENRPLYSNTNDQSKRFSEIATTWHWVDLNFTKYLSLANLRFGLYIEVKNLFNAKNAQIINPVTGDAYKYGDDIPSGWNDPRFPDRSFPVNGPFPTNPARYRAPRSILFGMTAEF